MVQKLTVQGTQVVRRQPKAGTDAISVTVLPESLAYKYDEIAAQRKTVDVRVLDGDKELTYGESVDGGAYFVCGLLNNGAPGNILDGRMAWKFATSADKKTFTYTIGLVKGKEVNETLAFTVTVYSASGARITQLEGSVHVTTVKDGEKGDKGDKGEQGSKGDKGDNGADGNGVVATESFFAKSDRAKIADMADITGWGRTFPEADAQQPYVWKVIKTTYTKSATTWSTPELVAVYDGGIGQNLLDNASFTAKANMTAWKVKSQYATISGQTTPEDRGGVDTKERRDGRNSWHDTCKATSAQVQCKDLLSQAVDDPTRTDAKDRLRLTGGKWYTLSFWARKNTAAGVLKVGAASAFKLAFGKKTVRLTQGVEYTIGVKGNITTAGATTTPTLVTTVTSPSGTTVATLRITDLAETTVTATVTATVTGDYTISSVKSEVGSTTSTVRVAEYKVEDGRDLTTFVYPLVADTTVKAIADGEELTSTPTDMSRHWTLTDDWKRHTLTFKTRADLSKTAAHNVLFRLYPALSTETWREVWVCMPKLEEGMFATTFVDDAQDAAGLDGCITRTTEWEAGKEYRNDSESKVRGIRYWDVVTMTPKDGGKQTAWVCRETHVSTEENRPTEVTTELGYRYWEKMNDMQPIRTSFLLAENAVIRFGQANRLAVMDKKGEKVQACLQGTDTEDGSVLWVGGETAAEANFSVGYDGTMRARRGVFSGLMKREKTVVTPENFLEYFSLQAESEVNYYQPRWEKIGLMMEFTGDFSKYLAEGDNGLFVFIGGIRNGSSVMGGKEEYRAMVGNFIYVANRTTELVIMTGNLTKGDSENFTSISISQKKLRSFECRYFVDDNGKENVGWNYTDPVDI